MRTNISGLMGVIADEERNFSSLLSLTRGHIYNVTIQELDGRVNVIQDYKKDFNEEMKEINDSLARISKLKATLYEKNNSFKLPDGRCIQQAIVDNTNLRKVRSFYNDILEYRSSKKRVTEVNNSYFECRDVNFDVEDIKKKTKEIESQIQKTDFEIAKLNSIEFDIEL